MKKSTIFKILTLFLTFVIFSCCSGCLFALSLQLKKNEERRQHLIEKQKERKAQADALIPEIDGYIFEALPKAAFTDQADWESKGFFDIFTFFKREDDGSFLLQCATFFLYLSDKYLLFGENV